MSCNCGTRKKIFAETEFKEDSSFELKDVLSFRFIQIGTVPVTIGTYTKLTDAYDDTFDSCSDGIEFDDKQLPIKFDATTGIKRLGVMYSKLTSPIVHKAGCIYCNS